MKKTKPLLSKILAVSVNESKRLPNFYKKLYFAKHTTLKPPLFSAGHNEMFCLLSCFRGGAVHPTPSHGQLGKLCLNL